MAASIPDDVLTNTARWIAVGFGYDSGQPAPTAVAGGMQLNWNLHIPTYGAALQGVWVDLRAGIPYTFDLTVASSTVLWRAGTPYTSSGPLMAAAAGRSQWTYTPATDGGTFVGIQVVDPVTTGNTVVSRLTVSVPRSPIARVLVDFTNPADSAVREWTDITAYLATEVGAITCTRGRSDEWAQVEPSRLGPLALDNSDGRFTFGYASGAYYPGVRPGRRVRVLVKGIDDDAESARYDGYTDGWPSRYVDGDTSRGLVTITAVDRMAALGDMRKLRDPLLEELGDAAYASGRGWTLDDPDLSVLDSTTVLAGGVDWLYGLQEQSGSTVVGDVSGAAGRPNLTGQQVGSGGTVEFGAAGIMPEGTAAQFSPASAGNGVVLSSTSRPIMYVGTEFAFFCQFAWSGSTGATIAQLGIAPDTRVVLSVTSTTVVATLTSVGGSTATVTKTTATNDNHPHFVCVSVSGTTVSLYVDLLAAATGTLPADMGMARGLTVGGTTSADVHQVAWVGFSNGSFSAARVANLAGLATGAAERSDARIARILGYLGIAATDQILETGLSDIAYQAMGGQSALDLIKTANEVEAGVLFADGLGRFVQQSRGHRYGAVAAVTPAPDDVDVDFEVQVDRSGIVNDIILSRPAGATVHVVDRDSVDEFGVKNTGDGATLYAASDNDLRAAAEWRLARLAQPQPRAPQVTIDLLTCSNATRLQALAAEIGDRLTISGMPDATTPGGSAVDVFIEGIQDTIGPTVWSITFATSPVWGADVWTLDTSALDTETVLTY